ncbi:MAG TPA: AMP-binding protein [Candidatus Krumholzibacteria bacterium]
MDSHLTFDALCAAGLPAGEATSFLDLFSAAVKGVPPAQAWRRVTRDVLTPAHPHDVHRACWDAVFRDWDEAQGPRPAWMPTEDEAAATNLARACKRLWQPTYAHFFRWSVEHREDFWRDTVAMLEIKFRAEPERVLDAARGVESARWFVGARMNIAESCFLAADDDTAIVYQREGGKIESLSYGGLNALANRFANSLLGLGVKPGDAVAIAMPMTVEAVAAYLGIVKAGAVVVSIADSFAPDEIRTRLRIARAEVAVTQDVIVRGGKTLPMYAKLVEAGAKSCIVCANGPSLAVKLRSADRDWAKFLVRMSSFNARAAGPDETINVLFSSGTTGDPKAIPWTHLTPIKCAMDGHYHQDIRPGDVVAWPTNLGWMMGPWLIYACLINRATIGLYYGAPNTPEFCRFVQAANVRVLGVVPSLVKAWRAHRMTDRVDWSGLRAFSSTGEASNADDYLWLMARAGYKPVVEYCGGTEIGGGYITQSLMQAASPATFSTPTLGLDVVILNEDGQAARAGELFLIPPSVGLSQTLLNRDHHDVYYENTPRGVKLELLRRHGDAFEALPGGYYRAHGRADDTMNLGGIKVSSAEIERVVLGVPGVSDVAAIAVDPPGGGPSLLVLYVVATPGAAPKAASIKDDAQQAIAAHLNPLFRVHDVRVTDVLPRTASNKVMRRVLRSQYSQ